MGRYNRLIGVLALLATALSGSPVLSADREQEFYEPGIDLPEGEGRDLIFKACTRCHTLEGVPAYSKYWGFDRWLPMVENMIEHGARLSDEEKITVTRYLAKYYGTD